MRLDASYNLCSKLESKLIFWRSYYSFSFAIISFSFECIFLIVILLKVAHDNIYAHAISQFRIPCMPPARPHVVLWISVIMVGLASATGTAVWRDVVVCEVDHLWAILNTFTAGNYALRSSFRDRAVSRPFLFQSPYDLAFMVSP